VRDFNSAAKTCTALPLISRQGIRESVGMSPLALLSPDILELFKATGCLGAVVRDLGPKGDLGNVGESSGIEFIGRRVTASLNRTRQKKGSIGEGMGHDVGILLQLGSG